MGKKMISGMIAMAFVCSFFLLITSCAKKQVQVTEPVKPTTQEMKAEEDTEAKAKAEEEARRKAEEEAKAEAERQARLGSLKCARNWLMRSASLNLRIYTLRSTNRI